MKLIYSTGIWLYGLVVYLSSFFNKKAQLFLKGRKNLFHFLQKEIKANPGEYIWFHCASLGEFEQGRPLIESIKKKYPHYKILLTFFSPSGYEVRKKYTEADVVCYLPLDTASNAKRFIAITQPKVAFFIKYEFWHFMLTELKKNETPTYLVSGIFRNSQIQFKPYGRFFLDTIKCFAHFFIQDQQSANLLQKHGLTNYTITGDTRFDRVVQIISEKKDIDYIERFAQGQALLVSGSTWKEDELVLAPVINAELRLRHIIAPHELSESRLKAIEQLIKKPFIRYSEIRATTRIENFEVIIIDSIGLLSHLYRYGDYAYIGGAFGKGLHNILEAATFGMPIFFGENYQKFNEAIDLTTLKGAFSISSSKELQSQLTSFMLDYSKKKSCDLICKNYVKSKTGATEKTINHCIEKGDL